MKELLTILVIAMLFASCAPTYGYTNFRPFKSVRRDGRQRIHKTGYYRTNGGVQRKFFMTR